MTIANNLFIISYVICGQRHPKSHVYHVHIFCKIDGPQSNNKLNQTPIFE
jgi:hypothetical protein